MQKVTVLNPFCLYLMFNSSHPTVPNERPGRIIERVALLARITASTARNLAHEIPPIRLALGVVLERDVVEQELSWIVDSLQLLEDL